MSIFQNKKDSHSLLFLAGFLVVLIVSIVLSPPQKTSLAQQLPTNANQLPTKIYEKKSKPIEKQVKVKVEKASADYNIKTSKSETSISGEELDQHLKGELKGLGHHFVKAGQAHEIDPVFLVALAAQETGWGDSELSDEPWNNVGGMICMPENYEKVFGKDYPNPGCAKIVSDGTNWQKFLSIEDSIQFKAAYLKMLYIDNGRDTISEIQKKYAPDYASNDQKGLNSNWIKNIVLIMNNVKEKTKI